MSCTALATSAGAGIWSEEIFRADGGDVTVLFGGRANPGAGRQFAGGSANEFDVGEAQIPRVMNHGAVFHHYQDGVAIAHFDFIGHSSILAFLVVMARWKHEEKDSLPGWENQGDNGMI
jgi:hypothetical protein